MKNFLFFISILILILISIVFYWPRFAETKIDSDALEYHQLAVNLLEGKGFYLEERGGQTMLREPVYPVFLFLNYKIFGIHPNLIRFEQVILVLLICFLVYRLSQKLFNDFTAKIAILAVVLHPLFVIYSGEITSEILAAFLAILSCFVFIKSLEERKLFWSALAGLVLAVLVLTKSVFIFIPIFLLPIYFLNREKYTHICDCRYGCIFRAVLFFLAFFLIVSPWLYRNHLYFGKWAIAERGGQTMYVHAFKSELSREQLKNYAISSFLSQYFVRLKNPSFDIFQVAIEPMNQLRKKLLAKGFSENQIDDSLAKESINLWQKHPVKNFLIGFLELNKAHAPTVPRNSIMFVYDVSGEMVWRVIKGLGIIFIRLFWFGLLLISLYGIFKAICFKKCLIFPLILFIFYLNAAIFFLEGLPRFIFPIYSIYFIFFAYGLEQIIKNCHPALDAGSSDSFTRMAPGLSDHAR